MITDPLRPRRLRVLVRLLASFAVAGVVAACASGSGGASAASSNIETLRVYSLSLVNQERAKAGLHPLVLDAKLSAAAQAHADDMRRRNYYSHVSPTGGEPPDRYKRAGGSLYGHFAENIARCYKCATPADKAAVRQLHEQWMGSPEHRKHIFKSDVTLYGFGLAETDRGKHYAVEEFYGPVTEEDVRRAGGFILHQGPEK
ncbi:uncharacterized protein YkwD [Amorphus suaedae]